MDNVNSALKMIGEQFAEGTVVWYGLFLILMIITVVYLLRGIYIFKKRSVESSNFVVFCIPVIVWAFLIFGGAFFDWSESARSWARIGIVGADYLIPSLFMLHIWSQVSYRPIKAVNRVAWLIVPILLIAFHLFEKLDSAFDRNRVEPYAELVRILFFLVVIIKSYLFCFNVFYQMPKHMRRSTYQMLIAITVLALANIVSNYFSSPENICNVMLAIAYIIMLYTLYTAFFIANSSNVIVTSRDFVFSSLSTIVITVSLKGNILDWNHKQKNGCHPLPSPLYKEPYTQYRKRIIDVCNGAVSPHDENILNIKTESGENHFLFTWHDIGYFGRKFGHLVEIAEVTKSYSKLRYFEEIAFYDNLTALHSRNAYIECVKQITAAENMPLLITIGDVNNLKKINDSLGHLYGDRLLLTIARAVKTNAPPNAFVARIGGDELVMLLPNAQESDAVAFISAVTRELNQINDPDIGTPSIAWGYSIMRDTTENYNDVFRAADAIMYEAKRSAREISISGIVPQE